MDAMFCFENGMDTTYSNVNNARSKTNPLLSIPAKGSTVNWSEKTLRRGTEVLSFVRDLHQALRKIGEGTPTLKVLVKYHLRQIGLVAIVAIDGFSDDPQLPKIGAAKVSFKYNCKSWRIDQFWWRRWLLYKSYEQIWTQGIFCRCVEIAGCYY